MSSFILRAALTVIGVSALAAPALAQADAARGFYIVGRAGAAIGNDAKFRSSSAISSLTGKADEKLGVTGEIGGGYDFGMFRIEQTAGYTQTKLNRDKLSGGGFTADGRTKALSVSIAGYIDIPVPGRIVPFVGGGLGVSRVEARALRTSSSVGSQFKDKDWGLRWHADAGVAYNLTPQTAIEISGRYSQTSKLKFEGVSGSLSQPVADTFQPRLSNISALVGVRYIF